MPDGAITAPFRRRAAEEGHQDRLRRIQRTFEYRQAVDRLFGNVGTEGYGTGAPGVGAGGAMGAGGRPALPDLPEFELPEYEEGEVARLTQKAAAPRVRTLREATRAATTRRGAGYENPNVRRMTVRQALQGYGTGLEGIISGARRGAVAEYGQRYGAEVGAAQLNFQTRVSALMQQYGNLWKEYLGGGVDDPSAPSAEDYLSRVGAVGSGGGGTTRTRPFMPRYDDKDPNDPTMIGSRRINPGGMTTYGASKIPV